MGSDQHYRQLRVTGNVDLTPFISNARPLRVRQVFANLFQLSHDGIRYPLTAVRCEFGVDIEIDRRSLACGEIARKQDVAADFGACRRQIDADTATAPGR